MLELQDGSVGQAAVNVANTAKTKKEKTIDKKIKINNETKIKHPNPTSYDGETFG